jgi:hypothetical protein
MASVTQCEVIFPFQALDVDQISLVVGEKITILHKNSTAWWVGRNSSGVVGVFPASYTQPVEAERPKFVIPKEAKTSLLQGHSACVTASQLQSANAGVAPLSSIGRSGGLSTADDRQMKRLLGIDDEEDGAPPRGLLASSTSLAGSMSLRSADLASPASLASSSRTPRAPAEASGSMDLDRIIFLRKEVRSLQSDVQKLAEREKMLSAYRTTDQCTKAVIQREVEQLKDVIMSRSNAVQDMERRIEVLKCALEGQPLPVYCPPSSGVDSTSNSITPTTTSPSSIALGPHFPSSSSAMDPAVLSAVNTASCVFTLEPSEAELEADPVARKIAKKLNKRIAEARATKEDYAKQAARLQKRLRKYMTADKELDAEISALGGEDTNDENVFAMLSEEEQQAAEKCQLIEVKYMKKAALFLETQVSTNAEAEALQHRVQKLKTKLSKGDEVASEQQRRKSALEDEINQLDGPVRALEQKLKESSERLTRVRLSLEIKRKDAAGRLAADTRKLQELRERIDKEKQRNIQFEEQLAKLLANRSPTPPAES